MKELLEKNGGTYDKNSESENVLLRTIRKNISKKLVHKFASLTRVCSNNLMKGTGDVEIILFLIKVGGQVGAVFKVWKNMNWKRKVNAKKEGMRGIYDQRIFCK